MDYRSKRFEFSRYDIYSWAKNSWAVIVGAVLGEIIKSLPAIQDFGVEALTSLLGENEMMHSFYVTLMASIVLLFKKWVTDYSNENK